MVVGADRVEHSVGERTLQADLADESLRSTENGSSTDKRILRRRWTRFWYSRVAWIVGLGEQAALSCS